MCIFLICAAPLLSSCDFIESKNSDSIVHCIRNELITDMQELREHVKYYNDEGCFGIKYHLNGRRAYKYGSPDETVVVYFDPTVPPHYEKMTIGLHGGPLWKHLKYLINFKIERLDYSKKELEKGFLITAPKYKDAIQRTIVYLSEDKPKVWMRCSILHNPVYAPSKNCQVWLQLTDRFDAKVMIPNKETLDVEAISNKVKNDYMKLILK